MQATGLLVSPRQTRFSRIISGYLVALVLVSGAAGADPLSGLSEVDQDAVTRQCLPVQFESGAAAYRQCVETEVSQRSEQAPSPTAALSFDEQYAVQQSCGPTGAPGDPAYQQCVDNQLAGLSQIAQAQLSSFDDDEIHALRQNCFDTQINDGVKAYRQCLTTQAIALQGLPRPDLSSLSLLQLNQLQSRCSNQQQATDYRQCLLDAVGASTEQPVTANTEFLVAESPQDEDGTQAESADSLTQNDTQQTDVSPGQDLSPAQDQLLEPAIQVPTAQATQLAEATDPDSTDTAVVPTTDSDSGGSEESSASLSTESSTLDDDVIVETSTSQLESDATTQTANAENSPPQTSLSTGDSSNSPVYELAQADAVIDSASEQSEGNPGSTLQTETISAFKPTAEGENPVQNDQTVPTAQDDSTRPSGSQDSILITLEALWSTAKNTISGTLSGLNSTSRMIVAAAMALPVLLIGFWLMMRGSKSEPDSAYLAPGERNPLVDRIGPSQQRRARQDRDVPVPTNQTDRLDLSKQADDLFADMPATDTQQASLSQLDTLEIAEAVTPSTPQSPSTTSGYADTPKAQADPEPAFASQHAPFGSDNLHDDSGLQADSEHAQEAPHEPPATSLDTLGSTERAGLLAWLNHQPPESRQSLAIEFLIYWLAYGDERYEPSMKRAIFQTPDPDEHERIKRWVLMQDIYAFSDVVYWLQHNCNNAQRAQILQLLMALLINENALTPVQNTVLRFLGDAFGLGNEQLNELFAHAYEQDMPPLPRVDKPRWWDTQKVDQPRRWDARAIAQQSPDIQHRVKLGLALGGELREEDVVSSFKRAVERCNPQRFNLLGKREQSLVERQLSKFEMAKDALLEVSA